MGWWKRREKRESDLERELRSDLELEAAELRDQGLSGAEARLAAQRAFGNAVYLKEEVRAAWGWTWVERLAQDLRYGVRVLRKSPGFAAIAVASLALGIGANTAVFSIVDAFLLKSLPVSHPEDLRILSWLRTAKTPLQSHSGYSRKDKAGRIWSGSFPYPAFSLFRKQLPQFTDLVGYAGSSFTVTANGTTEFAYGHFISDNYFAGLGVQPVMGTAPVNERGVVLTYRYWMTRFGADRNVVGREIFVNQQPMTVAGVAPPLFQGLYPGRALDVFVPLTMADAMHMPYYSTKASDIWWVQVFGRIRPGVSGVAAEAAVRATLGGVVRSYAGDAKEEEVPAIGLQPGGRGVVVFGRQWALSLYVLAATSGLVLLIACVNLANLLMARAAGRQREIALRLSIGASRGRLLMQLFTESALLAVLGGAAGVALSSPLAAILLRYGAPGALSVDARIDGRALAFTIGISLLTSLLFGIAPAWRTTRVDLGPALKGGGKIAGRGATRLPLGRLLVAAQVGLSVILLVGAGLFVRTLRSLAGVDLGFRTDRLLTFETDPSRSGYEGARLVDAYQRMLQAIAVIPGAQTVAMSQHGLIHNVESDSLLTIPGYSTPSKSATSMMLYCSAGFLGAMQIPLAGGRDIGELDGPSAPVVAVVNEAFAKNYYGGANPIGQTIYLGNANNPETMTRPIRIIGVAKDAHYYSVREKTEPVAYFSYRQMRGVQQMNFAIRTSVEPLSIAGAVRRAVAGIDRSIPVTAMKTEEQQITETLSSERMFAALVSAFGTLATLLAAIGVYGVLAYTVVRRTAEIGIRMALGASRSGVQRMVMADSLLTVGIGLVVGAPAALGLTKFVKSMLFGVTPTDTFSFVGALGLMLMATALAAWLPARRAARVDPMTALRDE